MAEAPALGAGLDDVGPVGDAVHHRLGQALIGEHLAPLAEGQVAGDDERSALVALSA
jgi:hypothetical protein